MNLRNRFGNAHGVARLTKHSGIRQLFLRARNARRDDRAAEGKCLQRWEIFRPAPRDACQRQSRTIERNENASFDKSEKVHLPGYPFPGCDVRNELTIALVRADE